MQLPYCVKFNIDLRKLFEKQQISLKAQEHKSVMASRLEATIRDGRKYRYH